MSMSRVDAKLANHRASVSLRAVRSEEDEILRNQSNQRKKNSLDRTRKANHQRNITHQYPKTTKVNVERTPKQVPKELIGWIGQYPSKYSGIGDEKSDDGESSIDEFELDKLEDEVNEFENNVNKLHQLKDSLNFHACFNLFAVIMITLVHLLFGGNSILPVPTQEAITNLFTTGYKWEYYYGSALFNITQVIIAPAIGNPMANHQIYNLSKLWSA